MLLTWEVTSAADAKNYYASSIALAASTTRQDYYAEGQEAAGVYSGKLAERLGLAGKVVDAESFHRLCDNLHPTREGERLTPRTNEKRRVAYDFTFSGPKSFSIAEALASESDRAAMLKAFDESISETVALDIEPDMQTRVRKDGADFDVTTGNVLAAGFDHATARPVDGQTPDPHRHRHLLIWNATYSEHGGENRVKAGQFGNLVRDKGYFRAAFYARLAVKLEALGYRIDRRGGNEWEIAGVPQSAIDKLSKRTAEVEAEAERLGITDAVRKAELAAKTRSKKQKDLTLPELRLAWAGQLDDAEKDALAAVYRRDIAAGAAVTPAEAVAFAIDHLGEQHSLRPEREFKRVALLRGLGDVTPEQIAAELPRHGVITGVIDGRLMATTEELQAEERFIAGFAADGRGGVCPVGVAAGLTRHLLDRGKVIELIDGQWEHTLNLLNSSNRVNSLEGPAGAGKSYLLKKFDEGARLAGETVTYLGTTTDACDELAKDGFAVNTVARFLLDRRLQQAAKGGRVVIDESSMLGHRDAFRLYELAAKLDLKLIHVGDPMQHGSVPRGAMLKLLKEHAGIQPFTLSEILRQEDAGYKAAAKLLSEGKPAEGFDAIDAKGWVKEIGDDAERCRTMAGDYVQAMLDKKSVILVSPTHREAAQITGHIRSRLREAGLIVGEDRTFTRLVAVNASEAERGLATSYKPGDVIQFNQNGKGGFAKGQRLTVGDPAEVPLGEAGKFSLYRPETVSLAIGDKVRFTGRVNSVDGGHKTSNGSTHSVAAFKPGGGFVLDNGWEMPADAGHFRLGWVDTSFASQGKTVKVAILGMASQSVGAINSEQMYVSSSRARERMTLYTDDRAAIRQAIQRSSQKLVALDLPPSPAAGADFVLEHRRRVRHGVHFYRERAVREAAPALPQPERQVGHGQRR